MTESSTTRGQEAKRCSETRPSTEKKMPHLQPGSRVEQRQSRDQREGEEAQNEAKEQKDHLLS